jgi:hypothetical protein
MKIIKRKITQAIKYESNIIDGVEYINITPNLNANYNINILLTSDNKNLGFFNVYDFSGVTGTTAETVNYSVTGYCDSRLYLLEKYTITDNFANKYFTSTNINNDGVDLSKSTYIGDNQIIHYYIDSVEYVDTYIDSGDTYISTYFVYDSFYPNNNFINKPIYKDPLKDILTNNIKVNNDVFIERQEVSVFENNMNLEFISNLYDLKTFAGGKYYNIFKLN